jgi:predicted HicB family RNase H-like nuclease
VHILVAPELLQQVQEAADAQGVSVAVWLRHAMRQVTPDDFPPSWRAEETAVRSHESGYFRRKFGLRLDEVTSRKLEALANTFDRSAAEIIRQLITQARLEDFPSSWQLAVDERRPPDAHQTNCITP